MFTNVNLTTLKAYLGIKPEVTTSDVYLQMQLDAGVLLMKQLLNRNLEHGIYLEQVYKVGDVINLTEFPVQSINSFNDLGVNIETTEYRLNKSKGRITFTNAGRSYRRYCFDRIPNVSVEYEAGYGVLPADLFAALYASIQSTFQLRETNDEYGGPVKRLNIYDVGAVDFVTSTGTGATEQLFRNNFAPFISQSTSFGNIDQECELLEVIEPISGAQSFDLSAPENSAYAAIIAGNF